MSDPSSSTPAPIARAPRVNVMLGAVVERFTRTAPTRHRVRDLSSGGVRIDQASALKPGETVLVTVGALRAVGATVRWVKDGHAGLAFAETINPDEARSKAAIAPPPPPKPVFRPAGWIGDMRHAYLEK